MTDPRHDLPRTVLPVPDGAYRGPLGYDASDPRAVDHVVRQLRAPAGAPNVLVVLLDDVGFGASSAFGGPCLTPTAERLASGGLSYNRFHTTALCSPTRAALLTGRNQHTVAMGGITEIATASPGYSSVRPNTCAPLAEVLRLNGYSTAQFGKCHEVPVWETGPHGPFDRWPTGSGFEHFFGFVGGETSQYHPALYEGTTPVEPDRGPDEGYHFMEDMTDRAIAWVRSQQAMTSDKPFFLYLAPGATHAPHHVPSEWIERYRGRFDQGWDRLREETFARQKQLGVVPADCELTPRPAAIPAWDAMPEELRPVLARQMEVYAAFLSYADHHVGRLVAALEQLGALDDTLVYYVIGDNGASAEGTVQGTANELLSLNHRFDLETPQSLVDKLDDLGGPSCHNHYSVGWAHAMDTPLQWTKQVASHWGGTRNGTVVHWPNGFRARGEVRSQFAHVIDVAATVLEAAGIPEPLQVNGVQQEPLHGTSMVYTFDDADAPERHVTQYFELAGNRGIYHHGWSAVTLHRTPTIPGTAQLTQPFDEDVWELYDGSTDWSQARDLAAEHPEKLRELKRQFLIEATRYGALPLDDRRAERANAELAGRPQLVTGRTQLLHGGMGRLSENAVLNLKNKSFAVTAQVDVPDAGAEGTIVAQGGAFGGWSLFASQGRLAFCYNLLGVERSTTVADRSLAAGERQVRAEFAYDGGGLGAGGDVTLFVDGLPAGKGRVSGTQPFLFSFDETTDVGRETGTSVAGEYPARDSDFTGVVHWVRLDAGLDADEHLLDPGQRLRIAMARQ